MCKETTATIPRRKPSDTLKAFSTLAYNRWYVPSSRIHETSPCIGNTVPSSSFCHQQSGSPAWSKGNSLRFVGAGGTLTIKDCGRDCGCIEDTNVLSLCRMPEDKKRKMAQRSRCKDWFHESCQKIQRTLCVPSGCLMTSFWVLWLCFMYTLT